MTPETAVRQAGITVDLYLRDAIENIDKRLGEGYAKSHPELVAAFINACAKDYETVSAAGLIEI